MLLVLVAGAVGAVFFVSHEVGALDARLDELNRQIDADYDALHVLRAEWGYLNQPQRLEALAARHLDLVPLAGTQMVRHANRRPAPPAPGIHETPGIQETAAEQPPNRQPDLRPSAPPPQRQASATVADADPTPTPVSAPPPRTRAADIGELDQHRPLDKVLGLLDRLIALARARTIDNTSDRTLAEAAQ